MLRRLGWLIGLSQRSRQTKTLDAEAYVAARAVKPVLMVDTVQEIAVYIHRFHNLDLFQQGWYQIKISMRWEDGDNSSSSGIPSRVVQYEALDATSNESSGVWKIDDKDNSFLSQPFRIKYARQDVRLCMMVSFTMPLERYEGSATSAVILRFELLYSPIIESIDAFPAAAHDFRIPPKALSGLHSYCPVHFDTLHAVLIDVSVHVSVMKSAAYKRPAVLSSDSSNGKNLASGSVQSSKKIASADKKLVSFVKSLLEARDTLLEEMQRLSKAVGQTIDLSEFVSTMDNTLLPEPVEDEEGLGQGKQQNNLEKLNSPFDLENDDEWLHNFSKEHLSRTFHLLGTQLHHLWNTFLAFHRENNTKILEYLRDTWTKDRRAEWSIWMVYSKVEMPHHFISGMDDTSNHSSHKRATTSVLKLNDPAQVAATRADLHRRSIAQMRINNRGIQDMHIFGDPMRVPIVIIERVWNAPKRTFSDRSSMRHVDKIDSSLLNDENRSIKHNTPQHSGRELKIVVFVHGFQGHHLDLRLIRNQWLMIDPKIECLMSESNEEKTHGDFREMGQRLAHEVVSFFKKKMDKHAKYGRLKNVKLSFVGHSIGNVIIRAALADSLMGPYRKYLHTYLSLSGPHLGYLYSSNSLFNSGLWLLKKLKSTQVIHQLTLTDDPDLQNTFFYKLCKQKTLDSFKNIILLSSPQDGYVPYHSARIESCQPASSDNSKRSVAFLEMLNNCMDQIRGPTLETSHHQRVFMRCDVNFDTTLYGRNLNSFIGRAAHIEFLESDIFARFVMWSFQDLFR
ncbi:protein FAM135B [Brassica rapa]|uniref:protein FAM135B n=1 Tax=Brassica campestris TaxID=3711 RepID=UPI0004F1B0DE|nr:protein FAM135B [Brassica rapa]XP_033148876.1 protein FAM135B [Brassica rapa]